jgi:hypothetical protein
MTRRLIAGLCIAALTGASAHAEVGFKQNRLHQTIELSGLSDDPSCTPRIIRGKVVQRHFASDGLSLDGFVFERTDGSRQYVNVEADTDPGLAMQSIEDNGLQRLLRVGRIIHGHALQCGAAGHVFVLQQIK